MSSAPRYWAVVPAAGLGARMRSDIPKQYLPLAGQTVLEHTLARLCAHPQIEKVVVALQRDDLRWGQLNIARHEKILRTEGGDERCHSVLNALSALPTHAQADDWVLVHDAARPCLRAADLDKMLTQLVTHTVGGILALPVGDTMKRSNAGGDIVATVERQDLWHAQTPQMFRLGLLRQCLQRALASGSLVTDEAQAIELAGYTPQLVAGHADNIKITQPQDLALAELFLRAQREELCG